MNVDDIAAFHARMMGAIQSVMRGMLTHMWAELDYQLHLIRATRGSHGEVHCRTCKLFELKEQFVESCTFLSVLVIR
jgi:hypothetical protein